MLNEQVELLTLDHDAASAAGHEGSSEVTRGIQSCKNIFSVQSQNKKLYSSFIISLKKRTCVIFLLNWERFYYLNMFVNISLNHPAESKRSITDDPRVKTDLNSY